MALIRPGAVSPRLPEIGRIFKGSPKRDREKSGRSYKIMGEDLSHFRFEPSEATKTLPSPDGNGTLADYLSRQYNELGDCPRTLPIQFLHSNAADNFAASYNELWQTAMGAERCVRRCDGETQVLHLEGTVLSKDPIPCAAIGQNDCPLKCKPVGRLAFILPALKYPGKIILTTHSIYDILEIQGNLALYEGWDLNKIPWQLCRAERTISYNDRPVKKWLCHLVVDPRFGQRMLESAPTKYLEQFDHERTKNN